jgi:hypothetical protein
LGKEVHKGDAPIPQQKTGPAAKFFFISRQILPLGRLQRFAHARSAAFSLARLQKMLDAGGKEEHENDRSFI